MKKILALILILSLLITVVGCGNTTPQVEEPANKVMEEEPVENEIEEGNKDEELNTELEEEPSMEKDAELNAEKYPAGPGTILVTKGDHDFTGMDYYFKGEIVGITTIENNIGDPSAWLVRNDKGYVMPIQHDMFEASEGDIVEVWGTLTGNGYSNFEGIDNVVGETGSMHAIAVSVNGTRQ
ncbi:hypothetical protein [Tissierella creatinophila]|uniref:DUF5666 domain-containing protein n=1 Tax=Tissierella creatinophila DSM 6911 TaxID=1123403 RepID=A0A1U7M6E3_TISCR|nr:hypothetical protein [Tissierella creatinophila]OLS02893.1 hypothetical protein TICRE_11660 [Tissierella creatinophila DSM 6911]